MTRIVWKFSACSLLFQWWFKFLEKLRIWFKNVTTINTVPIRKVEIFLKSNFWHKSNTQNSASTKPLNWKFAATGLLYIFAEVHKNALELLKMSKNWSWKETGPGKYKKFPCSGNPRQIIWNKMEWSSKTGQ